METMVTHHPPMLTLQTIENEGSFLHWYISLGWTLSIGAIVCFCAQCVALLCVD